jgi:hypothetical protein
LSGYPFDLLKLFWLGQASISVSSMVKHSSDRCGFAYANTRWTPSGAEGPLWGVPTGPNICPTSSSASELY